MRLHAPHFWFRPNVGPISLLLRPISLLVTAITRKRLRRNGYHSLVPVLCCGNITVGGSGKTPLTIDLTERLQKRGYHPQILSRGYKRRSHANMRVDLQTSTAQMVGDEPLLLARTAPTWVGANRAQTAQLAIKDKADCLVMDDGLQNPSLFKNLSILVLDGATGLGNRQVLPAGPLREPIDDILKRIKAAVILGDDIHNLKSLFPQSIFVAQAKLIPGPEIRHLLGQRIIAFAGIGHPEKFFNMLKDAGVPPIRSLSFPDHHTYSKTDIQRLENLSNESGTTLVTTAKDAVKLPSSLQDKISVVNVELLWQEPTAPDHILDLLFENS
ncbi:tetraacyldisaccharide 4'-kinase [Swingsia samuiensis]|uniref:Tetraacyldisaccharide 4'-kinase n=1 Tax=Swingsia samuiensis TaxID=1293412 RepID=A0A4Y6UJ71_9PROT|nr:tetraacyldisaccharide 4'-kinase [Swingsia samuiensis]QDH17653.1 tetraacyldisaccharide 4'-kinase [Swingsia samuiensis]